MKKIILSVLVVLGCISFVPSQVEAQSLTNPVKQIFIEGGEKNTVFKDTTLKDYTGIPDDATDAQKLAAETGGQYQLRRLIEVLIDFLKRFLVPIGVVLLLIAGIQLVSSRGNDDALTDKKRQIRLMAIGYIAIALSVTLVDFVFFGQEGQILRTDDTGNLDTGRFAAGFWDQIQGVFDYISTFFIALGMMILVASMIQLMLGAASEDALGKIKQRMMVSGTGVLIMVAIDQLINVFSSQGEYVVLEDGKEVAVRRLDMPSLERLIEFTGGWTNFVLSFIAVIAVVALIWAGIRLVTNFGDDEAMAQTKRIFRAIVIGLVVLFAAYAIIATLLGGAIF